MTQDLQETLMDHLKHLDDAIESMHTARVNIARATEILVKRYPNNRERKAGLDVCTDLYRQLLAVETQARRSRRIMHGTVPPGQPATMKS